MNQFAERPPLDTDEFRAAASALSKIDAMDAQIAAISAAIDPEDFYTEVGGFVGMTIKDVSGIEVFNGDPMGADELGCAVLRAVFEELLSRREAIAAGIRYLVDVPLPPPMSRLLPSPVAGCTHV